MQRDATRTVNYTSMFKAPLSFRISFQKWTIPYTFEVEETAIFFVSLFLIRSLLGGVIDSLSVLTHLNAYVISIGASYGMTRMIQHANTDGKRIDRYLVDMLFYFIGVIATKRVLYKGKYQRFDDRPIVYEEK